MTMNNSPSVQAFCLALLLTFGLVGGGRSALAQALAPEAADSLDLTTLPATLMLSLEDMLRIEHAIAAGPRARRNETTDDGADAARFRLRTPLYLSGVIYDGPRSWTIWINDQAITPQTDLTEFQIVAVGPNMVQLAIPWGAEGTRDVRLYPHQTFLPFAATVVEGRR